MTAPAEEARATSLRDPDAWVAWLVANVARLLRLDAAAIDPDRGLMELGLDSLGAAELLGDVEHALGRPVPLALIIEASSLRALAAAVAHAQSEFTAPAVDPAARAPLADLSPGQYALWIAQARAPHSTAYVLARAVRIVPLVDLAAFVAAAHDLATRHAAMRTTIVLVDDVPRLHVTEVVDPLVARVEASGALDDAALDECLANEAAQPFDLARGPLVQMHVHPRPDGSCVLLLRAHHVVVDFASVAILLRDFARAYTARAAGRAPAWPSSANAVPPHHADLAASRDWWRDAMAHAPPAVGPLVDHARVGTAGSRGGAVRARFDPALATAVRGLARRHDTSAFVVLLAAFGTLLHRYTAAADLIVGAPAAARPAALADVVGYFVNALPLRLDLGGDPPFATLIDRVRATVRAAISHADVPFAWIAADAPTAPLLRTAMVHHASHRAGGLDVGALAVSDPDATLVIDPLTLRPLAPVHAAAPFDVVLTTADVPDGLGALLEYDADLFDTSTMTRLLAHLDALLTSATRAPTTRIGRLALMDASEARALLRAWSGRAASVPPGLAHTWIADHARTRPDAVAVTDGATHLSYAALDRAVGALAASLRGAGVARGDRVGLLHPPSLERIVAMLAVLHVGAAFVPMDADAPAARLAMIAEDAGFVVVLAADELIDRVPPGRQAVIRTSPRDETTYMPAVSVGPLDAAYVIFTSGSTGRPRGVVVTHGGLAWLARAGRAPCGIEPESRVLQFASPAFDVSIWEVFVTLVAGATLVMHDRTPGDDPRALMDVLRRDAITSVTLSPSLLAALPVADLPACIATVVTAGERCSAALAHAWRARCRFVNAYGPTETTVCATTFVCGNEATDPPIGRPIDGARTYVLDRAGEAVPPGVEGELHLGGAGVARGYLARAGATAARFVPDPFCGESGARMYRSGDRARWRHDGEIEYLGRVDAQVKLRGVRIEPGEIEAVLQTHPAVAAAAVVVRETRATGAMLVAYVVADATTDRTTLRATLRTGLIARLPAVMVPAAIVVLDALPRTLNGKLDVAALPAPDRASDEPDRAPPEGPTERAVADAFATVLGTTVGSRDDDFFALGGHSLLAVRALARVRDATGVALPVRTLFDHPRVADLAIEIDRLVPDDDHDPLPRPVHDGRVVASFAQERLWFLDRLEPGAVTYHMPGAIDLRGPLDVDALIRALDTLVARHEALRTTLVEVDGRPVQSIAAPSAFALTRVRLDAVPADAREQAAMRLARSEAARPFDLAQGPLARGVLIALDARHHLLVVVLHHAIADGVSFAVIVRELSALYDGASLEAPAHQYADFAHWQRAVGTDGPEFVRDRAFWTAALAGAPPTLSMPTDRPRPPVRSARGASVAVAIGREDAARIASLARETGSTVFMVVLTAWGLVLGRYAGQHDVIVGAPVAGRTRSGFDDVVGLFVNTLALRVRFDGAPRFVDVLASVRAFVLDAFAHASFPFERLVTALDIPRDLATTPVFQTLLALQNDPAIPLAMHDLAASFTPLDLGAAKHDLTLALEPTLEGAWHGTLDHDAALFDRATAARLVAHFTELLFAAVRAPTTRVDRLPLVTSAERAALRIAPPPFAVPPGTVFDWFTQQAQRRPDALAVVSRDVAFTYGQLAARASGLARRLRAQGVGPEVRVGVCLPRSARQMVALLGILQAGGVYVPLDPAYPRERLAFMLRDSGVQRIVGRLDGEVGSMDLGDELLDEPLAATPVHADGLAYVIYTSGSTGQPRAVGVSHTALTQSTAARMHYYDTQPGTYLLLSSFAFDSSVAGIFWTLATGGTLVVADEDLVADPAALARWIAPLGVTHTLSIPGYHALLLDHADALTSLRVAIVAGEACPVALPSRHRAVLPAAALYNEYGPTEATVWTTVCRIDGEHDATVVPIGIAAPHARVSIVDASDEPVPRGAIGELCVGGDALARGYLGRPGSTAGRFAPDPFASTPGARWYRTGDRARVRADGLIEFHGRRDGQVKLRGHRIELSEIEAVLARVPGVRAVVARIHDGRILVAHLVADAIPPHETLHSHVAEQLPAYMVPTVFMRLDALPRTANGKIDHAALPSPTAAMQTAFVPPRGATEAAVAAVWSALLGHERISVHDDFFALGGHSLLAAQMVARVREHLGVDVPVRALFAARTIAGFAARVDEVRAGGGDALPPMEPHAGDDAPLSYPQTALYDWERARPGTTGWHVTAALRLEGPLDETALRDALDAIVQRHEVLRTTFVASADGTLRQHIAPVAPFVRPREDLRAMSSDAVASRLRDEAREPFDLAHGPLLRARWFQLEDEVHVLVTTGHHIVLDGWSLHLLARELVTPTSSPPRLQYADFARWQRDARVEAALERDAAHVRARLAGARPLDFGTHALAGPARRLRCVLAPDTVHALRALARDEGATLFVVLLAALTAHLSSMLGVTDVVVASPNANRGRDPRLGSLVGHFLNHLLFRVDVGGRPTFRLLVRRTRDVAWDTFAHQDAPLARVVGHADPLASPFMRVVFNLHTEPTVRDEVRMGAVILRPFVLDVPPVRKNDLSLHAVEMGDTVVLSMVTALDAGFADALASTVEALAREPDGALPG